MPDPNYDALMREAMTLCDTKSHDYAQDGDTHSNFRYAAAVAAPFPDRYKPYAVLIGIKLARLAELLSGKSPKHESLWDSFKDLVNYGALMGARWREEKELTQ